MRELRVIGEAVVRKDAMEKATGAAIFAADLKFSKQLWARFYRSPLPHGKILRIDTSKERGAIQCGYCTPGMILAAKAFLDENPWPSEAEIRLAIAGNICRCAGYLKIVEAIQAAAEELA